MTTSVLFCFFHLKLSRYGNCFGVSGSAWMCILSASSSWNRQASICALCMSQVFLRVWLVLEIFWEVKHLSQEPEHPPAVWCPSWLLVLLISNGALSVFLILTELPCQLLVHVHLFFTAAPTSAKILCCKETRVMSSEDDTGGEVPSGSFWEVRGMMVCSVGEDLLRNMNHASSFQCLLRERASWHEIYIYMAPLSLGLNGKRSGMCDHSPVPTFSVIAENLGGILEMLVMLSLEAFRKTHLFRVGTSCLWLTR